MKTLLAIDTSTQACSVALLYNGEMYQEYRDTPREHTRLVLPMVNKLLQHAGISLDRVDCLAYTQGPGSFTGLRIGFGIVQGLAFGAGIPVIPVSTLEVLADRAMLHFKLNEGLVVPVLDARMGEVYWASYLVRDGGLVPVQPPSVARPQQVTDSLSEQALALAVGSGWPHLAACGVTAAQSDARLMPDALSVLRVAGPLVAAGLQRPIEDSGLLYIRDEVTWKKREKIRG